MTADHFEMTLDIMMSRQPFKPFTVELNTGQRIEIDHPRAVSSRNGFAVFTSPGGPLIMFDHESVNQSINAPAHAAPGKRRNKQQRLARLSLKRPNPTATPGREYDMTAEHFDEALELLVLRRPFKAFTIELNTGQRIEIDHPGATTWRNGFAVFTSPGGPLIMFDHESVNQIIDVPAHAAPGKRRSK